MVPKCHTIWVHLNFLHGEIKTFQAQCHASGSVVLVGEGMGKIFKKAFLKIHWNSAISVRFAERCGLESGLCALFSDLK